MPLRLDVLPTRLQLATIERRHTPSITHTLLQHIFYSDVQSFLSVTLTPTELSMVIQTEHIASFVACSPHIQLCPTVWRCLEVSSGECGGVLADFVNTVHTIAAPLAREKISIFQLSTFDADYTLVREDQLQHALHCLRRYFDIPSIQDHESQHGDVGGEMERSKDDDDDAGVRPSSGAADDLHFHPFKQPISNTNVYVAQFSTNHLHMVMRPLVYGLLYASSPLFSLTVVDQSLSMVADDSLLPHFPGSVMNILHSSSDHDGEHAGGWGVIAVGDETVGLGFEETGIVAAYTKPMKELKVNCFYLSTFHVDLILIPHIHADAVLSELSIRVDRSRARQMANTEVRENEIRE